MLDRALTLEQPPKPKRGKKIVVVRPDVVREIACLEGPFPARQGPEQVAEIVRRLYPDPFDPERNGFYGSQDCAGGGA